MNLYLLRHCESMHNYNKLLDGNNPQDNTDNGLTEKGIKQAEELAKTLKSYNVNLVIRSQLRRTKETIKPYLKNNDKKVIISKLISERDAGIFAGRPKTVMQDYCDKKGIN